MTLGCLVTGYFPGPVTMTWDTASLNRSTLTFPAVQNLNSSLYTTSSQVTVSGEWSKQKFTCSVAHTASNTTTTKAVTGEPGLGQPVRQPEGEGEAGQEAQGGGAGGSERPTPLLLPLPPGCTKSFPDPSVKLFYSSCDPRGDTHTTIQLLCLISGYTPGKVKVTWLVDGREATDVFPHTGPERVEGKLASTYSELNITQGQWVSQITYTCRVTYYGFTYDNHARRCTGTVLAHANTQPLGIQRGGQTQPHSVPSPTQPSLSPVA